MDPVWFCSAQHLNRLSPVALACDLWSFYPVCISVQPTTTPHPNKSPSNLSRFVATKDPQSGFDELVNPGPQSAVRAGSMMAESLKGWSDGFIGQESKGGGGGQTVRGLVIGLIYPHSPECHLHQLTSVIAAVLLRCLRSRKRVYGVCACVDGGWMDPS